MNYNLSSMIYLKVVELMGSLSHYDNAQQHDKYICFHPQQLAICVGIRPWSWEGN